MNQAREHMAGERWERVASSFLRPLSAPSFSVAVTGPDDSHRVRRIARELREGLGDLAADEGRPEGPVRVADWGAVDERRLKRLQTERLESPDLLLWCLANKTAMSPRSFYLLGIFAWTLSPKSIGCVMESREARASQFHAGLHAIRSISGLECPFELHLVNGAPGESPRCTLGGIVQAALARADAHSRAARSPKNPPSA